MTTIAREITSAQPALPVHSLAILADIAGLLGELVERVERLENAAGLQILPGVRPAAEQGAPGCPK